MIPLKTYAPEEIAEALGVSNRTVGEWIARGELLAVNVSRARGSKKPRLRVTEAAVNQFLAARELGTPPVREPRRKLPPVKEYV